MTDITENEYFVGIEVDFKFNGRGPSFGDLFTICGYENPNFPPPGEFPFNKLDDLLFSQIDDYFGVATLSDEGDDVAVWLFPVVDGDIVDHHPGPFDALRISYNVLRNPIHRSEHFYLVLERLTNELPVTPSVSLSNIKEKVSQINSYWLNEGITPGSEEALEVDF